MDDPPSPPRGRIEGEHLALPTGPEQPVAAGAELGQQRVLAGVVLDNLVDGPMLPVGGPGGAGPVELGRQLARHTGVELVRDQVDRSLGGVDVHVGEPESALPRTLHDPDRLGLGVRHDVAGMDHPAVLGDQRPFVPAVAQRPPVEPAEPAGLPGHRVQLDSVQVEPRQSPAQGQVDLVSRGHREQDVGGLALVVLPIA